MVSLKDLPSCIKRVPVFAVLIVYVFITSGCIITISCLFAQVIWFINKTCYRHVVTKLTYLLFGQMIWLCVDWADTQVTMFGEEKAYQSYSRQPCLISLSHRGDFDWLIGMVVSAKFDFLQNIRTLPKKSVKYVPGFGQLLWAMECPFLNRSWQIDEVNIRKGLSAYANYPFPIQVCIFCEGTRFTDEKYRESVVYAEKMGIQPLKHHLLPRTKGYAILADSLRRDAHFDVTYDVGFAYPPGQSYINGKQLTLRDVLAGNKVEVYFYLRMIPMSELPDSMDDLQIFCHQLYAHKDEAYQYFVDHGTYPYPSRPMIFTSSQMWKLRLNVLFWFTITFLLPSVWLLRLALLNIVWLGLALAIGILSLIVTCCLLVYARTSQGHLKHS